MKLNIGCGRQVLDGWFNIDAALHPVAPRSPELLYAFQFDAEGELIERIPLDDGCADEIMAIHVFEHFYQWEGSAVLREWHRLLKQGGRLILELPDFIKCCRNVVEQREGKKPDQLQRWGLYGDPREKNKLMCHPWGWGPEELMNMLGNHGFTDMKQAETQFHINGRANRDMRIECIKG